MFKSKHNSDKNRIRKIRSKVFRHMLATRSHKYRSFLFFLHFFKYAAIAPTRGEFLKSYYTLMRYIDDVVDGDIPLPKQYVDECAYLNEKISFSQSLTNPTDEVDYMMIYCFELANKIKQDFHQETKDILDSLLFDAKRRGKYIIFSEEELAHHFHLLDIKGTIKATLKIFNEDPNKYTILEPLGMASRYQFDIEDYQADIAAGYINISKEECNELDLELEDLKDFSNPKISKWKSIRAMRGLELLQKHKQQLPSGKFSLLARATFPLVYEKPAKRIFKSVIMENF